MAFIVVITVLTLVLESYYWSTWAYTFTWRKNNFEILVDINAVNLKVMGLNLT